MHCNRLFTLKVADCQNDFLSVTEMLGFTVSAEAQGWSQTPVRDRLLCDDFLAIKKLPTFTGISTMPCGSGICLFLHAQYHCFV